MKNLLVVSKALRSSVWFLILFMSTCMIGFTSCSNDDEQEEVNGGPYTGVWLMPHIKIVENGEVEEGDVPTGLTTVKLTLFENGNYTYYALVKGDTADEDELVQHEGKWSFSEKQLKLESNQGGTAIMNVRSWTDSKMVTYQEEDGDSETRTWTKMKI